MSMACDKKRCIAASLLLLISAPLTYAEGLIIPRDLVSFVRENQCEPVTGFYDRPGVISPPYVYLNVEGRLGSSDAAVWCQKKEGGKTKFLLLLNTSTGAFFGCTARIEYWNFPGGLSAERRRGVLLDDFHYLAKRQSKGPDALSTSVIVLTSSYDGVDISFLCHNGEWLYRLRH